MISPSHIPQKASTVELEGVSVYRDRLVSLAAAAKKSISLAEYNTLVTARGPADAPV